MDFPFAQFRTFSLSEINILWSKFRFHNRNELTFSNENFFRFTFTVCFLKALIGRAEFGSKILKKFFQDSPNLRFENVWRRALNFDEPVSSIRILRRMSSWLFVLNNQTAILNTYFWSRVQVSFSIVWTVGRVGVYVVADKMFLIDGNLHWCAERESETN